MTLFFTWLLKLLIVFSRFFKLGAGSTWPGHIILTVKPNFLRCFNNNFKGKVIIIAGTNGKTTTSKMLRTILEANNQKVIHNEAGANLLNGIASSIVLHSSILGALNYNCAIFEVDENTLPLLLNEITPDVLVILNLFRDQLDRYGEVDSIAAKWHKALLKLPKNVDVILNADDPHIAFLGKDINAKVSYFGIDDDSLYLKTKPHAMDSGYCPNCGERLVFEGIYLAHLGKWRCASCGTKRPVLDYSEQHKILPGVYNFYNVQAAILAAKKLNVKNKAIEQSLQSFIPAFGRQEEFSVSLPRRHPEPFDSTQDKLREGSNQNDNFRKVKIFLSKNPTGFNESIRTVKKLGGEHFLLVLNDRIPDGRDVSWIWDVDFEEIADLRGSVYAGGDRVFDLALRLKYANVPLPESRIYADLKSAIKEALNEIPKSETLYILATYSAMLEVRKILTGRKIL